MSKRKSGRNVHGIVLLDKRLGVSSNKALQEVRKLFNANKAGHTGSLDPLATGLLPLCFGEATKVSALMLDDDKRYQVDVQLGIMTDTGDAEGRIIKTCPVPRLSLTEITVCLQRFTGAIEQVPPMYSALKYQGKKLYELARAGETVDRPARAITIYALQLLAFTGELLTLDVRCSKGTYIRSLAEDLGHALNTCATVTALRRLEAGQFKITEALTLDELMTLHESELDQRLLPADLPLASLPSVQLSSQQAQAIRYGQVITHPDGGTGTLRLYHEAMFLGLGEKRLDGKIAPKKLFNFNDVYL